MTDINEEIAQAVDEIVSSQDPSGDEGNVPTPGLQEPQQESQQDPQQEKQQESKQGPQQGSQQEEQQEGQQVAKWSLEDKGQFSDDSGSVHDGDKKEPEEGEQQEEEQQEPQQGSQQKEQQDPQQGQQLKLDADVITAAVQAGMTIQDAMLFTSEDSLRRVTEIMSTPKEGNDDKGKQEEVNQLSDALSKLDPEEYDPEVIKLFEGMNEQLQAQKERLDQIAAREEWATKTQEANDAAEIETWFDTKVRGLGDDFKESLGEGDYSSLDKSGAQFAKRDAVADQMAVLMAGMQATGRKVPSRDEVFDAAAKIVLSDEFKVIGERDLRASLQDRSSQHLQRTDGQNNRTKPGDPAEETAAMLDRQYFSK